MAIGMLWFDDDARRTLNEKVARAFEHYKPKYGATPTLCFVNPSVLKDKDAPEMAAGVLLRPARTVMLHHFWIGVGETGNGNGRGAEAHGKNGKRGARSVKR